MCIFMIINSFFLLQLLCDIIYVVISYWLFNYQNMTAHSLAAASLIYIYPYHI